MLVESAQTPCYWQARTRYGAGPRATRWRGINRGSSSSGCGPKRSPASSVASLWGRRHSEGDLCNLTASSYNHPCPDNRACRQTRTWSKCRCPSGRAISCSRLAKSAVGLCRLSGRVAHTRIQGERSHQQELLRQLAFNDLRVQPRSGPRQTRGAGATLLRRPPELP